MNLERSEFRAWLESGPSDEPAGVCGKISACPVAKYLRDLFGGSVSVELSHHVLPSGDQRSNPGWVSAFITLVDGDHLTGQPITRGECVELLDLVTR